MAGFNLLKRFKSETKGNVSLMFAGSFTASFLMIGAAFDLTLLHKNQEKTQYLVDAAALAALRFDGSTKEKEAVFIDHLESLAKASGRSGSMDTSYVTVKETETSFTLEATVVSPNELLILQNIEGFDTISTFTTAVVGIQDVEIALVLDISSSMRGTKIIEAQNSAKLFVNELLEDENLDGRISISLVPFGGTVRVPEELSDLLDYEDNGNNGNNGIGNSEDDEPIGFAEKWIDGKWNQCFHFDISDIEEGLDPDGSYGVTPDFTAFRNRDAWCPITGNEMVPLTDEPEILEQRIDELTLSNGTGSDHGMAWAFATLNDEWKNRFPGGLKDTPARNKAATRKIIVFMTDGNITGQVFLEDSDFTGQPPFHSGRRIYGISGNDATGALYSICDTAKENEMEIYTIGYQLRNNAARQQLEYCSTSPSHNVSSDAGELDSIFSTIAASISPLRTSN